VTEQTATVVMFITYCHNKA